MNPIGQINIFNNNYTIDYKIKQLQGFNDNFSIDSKVNFLLVILKK